MSIEDNFSTMPLRFRVWDKEAGDFIQGVNGENRLNWRKIADLLEPTVWDCATELDDIADRFIVSQDTGLKDRNGENIYSGDVIIDHSYTIEGVGRLIGLVAKSELVAGYTILSPMNNFEPGNIILSKVNNYEVIGNIWQNPELLEENK